MSGVPDDAEATERSGGDVAPLERLGVEPTDVVLAAGVAVVLVLNLAFDVVVDERHPIDGWTYLLTVLITMPLVVRTRRPLLALYATGALLVLYVATDNPMTPIPAVGLLMLYSVAAHRGRRSVVLVLATLPLIAGVASVFVEQQEPEPSERALLLSFTAIAIILGDAVRSRRALAAAYEEQLRLAELQQEAAASQRVMEERRRIARDLHDVVAHGISSITVQAGVAAHVIDERPEVARDALDEIRHTGQRSLNELRATLRVLRDDEPGGTAPAPTLDDLDDLVRSAAAPATLSTSGLETPAETESEPESADDPGPGGERAGTDQVDPVVQLVAFRIVQEALTNVAKHAPGEIADVTVAVDDDRVLVEVTNAAPTSAVPDADGTGYGLVGMAERASSVGGSLTAGPRFDGRFVVSADLPVHPVTTELAR